jgi:hypothetical protein
VERDAATVTLRWTFPDEYEAMFFYDMACKIRKQGIPSGYIAADVSDDGPSADMSAPENSPAEIARRAEAAKRKGD